MTSSLTTLVGEFLGDQHDFKWDVSVYCNANKHIYGIKGWDHCINKFNPTDKSSISIDLGRLFPNISLLGGTEDEKGFIYCLAMYQDVTRAEPYCYTRVVKIDTATDTTTLLDARPTDENGCWTDGVLGLDGHIYFMPKTARRILKLNTDTDTIENVGVFFKSGYKCIAAVRGLGGFIYGIPLHSKCIMKFDPVSLVTSYVGEKHNNDFECLGEGALASDGCIYAMTGQFEVLKIDTNKNKMSWALVGNKVDYTYVMRGSISRSIDTANAIAGIDGCVYFPNILTVKYDPHTDHTCFVGNDFGYKQSRQWLSGALAPDGVIYCMPYAASHVLAIDPYREFTESLASEVNQHPPEEFGGLFAAARTAAPDPRGRLLARRLLRYPSVPSIINDGCDGKPLTRATM